ncbi:MAG: hypothetical protein OSA89_14455 [Mariniblastus sp.]|nr:hypothetical protein [Mariniblastus sp.]
MDARICQEGIGGLSAVFGLNEQWNRGYRSERVRQFGDDIFQVSQNTHGRYLVLNKVLKQLSFWRTRLLREDSEMKLPRLFVFLIDH